MQINADTVSIKVTGSFVTLSKMHSPSGCSGCSVLNKGKRLIERRWNLWVLLWFLFSLQLSHPLQLSKVAFGLCPDKTKLLHVNNNSSPRKQKTTPGLDWAKISCTRKKQKHPDSFPQQNKQNGWKIPFPRGKIKIIQRLMFENHKIK